MLRISPVLATFSSPNYGFYGLSAIKALKPTSIGKKRVKNKPPARKNSPQRTAPKPCVFEQMPSLTVVTSNGKNFCYCKFFLRPWLNTSRRFYWTLTGDVGPLSHMLYVRPSESCISGFWLWGVDGVRVAGAKEKSQAVSILRTAIKSFY
jgi:hypothetical protein